MPALFGAHTPPTPPVAGPRPASPVAPAATPAVAPTAPAAAPDAAPAAAPDAPRVSVRVTEDDSRTRIEIQMVSDGESDGEADESSSRSRSRSPSSRRAARAERLSSLPSLLSLSSSPPPLHELTSSDESRSSSPPSLRSASTSTSRSDSPDASPRRADWLRPSTPRPPRTLGAAPAPAGAPQFSFEAFFAVTSSENDALGDALAADDADDDAEAGGGSGGGAREAVFGALREEVRREAEARRAVWRQHPLMRIGRRAGGMAEGIERRASFIREDEEMRERHEELIARSQAAGGAGGAERSAQLDELVQRLQSLRMLLMLSHAGLEVTPDTQVLLSFLLNASGLGETLPPSGVPEEKRDALMPRTSYAEACASSPEVRMTECTICLAPFDDEGAEGEEQGAEEGGRGSVRVLPCSHVFHAKCIDRWFDCSDKCPCCRHRVGADDAPVDAPEVD